MEIRRLSYFVRVAEDGSLTRAAGMLRVAQSALSRQMRLLEEELGVTLFERNARGMRLTNDGEGLLSSVAAPLRELELAIQGIRTGSSRAAANLALGVPSSIADLLGQQLAIRLRSAFPAISFRIVEGPTGALADWLSRGMIDLAILEEVSRNDLLIDRQLLCLPFVLIGPAGGTTLSQSAITLEEALTLPLVAPSHHLGVRATINDAALRLGLTLNIQLEVDSTRLMKDLVRLGMSYALLPNIYALEDVEAGTLRGWPIIGPGLTLDVLLSSRKASRSAGRQFEAVAELIAELILEAIK